MVHLARALLLCTAGVASMACVLPFGDPIQQGELALRLGENGAVIARFEPCDFQVGDMMSEITLGFFEGDQKEYLWRVSGNATVDGSLEFEIGAGDVAGLTGKPVPQVTSVLVPEVVYLVSIVRTDLPVIIADFEIDELDEQTWVLALNDKRIAIAEPIPSNCD